MSGNAQPTLGAEAKVTRKAQGPLMLVCQREDLILFAIIKTIHSSPQCNHTIILGLEVILKPTQSQLAAVSWLPHVRPGFLVPYTIWPSTPPGMGYPQPLCAACSVPHHSHSEEFFPYVKLKPTLFSF